MPNQPNADKRHMSYWEWRDVYSEIERIAKERGVPPAEVIRETVLDRVNRDRKKRGKPPIQREPGGQR